MKLLINILLFFYVTSYSQTTTLASSVAPGWNATDATDCLVNAINQVKGNGGDTLRVDNDRVWNIKFTRTFNWDDFVLDLRGCTINVIPGTQDYGTNEVINDMFGIINGKNVTVLANGATLTMPKDDYTEGEFRHVWSVAGVDGFKIIGGIHQGSGGDGMYFANCRNVVVENVLCNNNRRQGLSIIGVNGCRIENSVFTNTTGTPPAAGIDIEPNNVGDTLQNILIKNCRFTLNDGNGFFNALAHYTGGPEISIDFEDNYLSGNRRALQFQENVGGSSSMAEMTFSDPFTDSISGYFRAKNVHIENSPVKAIYALKTSESYELSFENIVIDDVSKTTDPLRNNPIALVARWNNDFANTLGGVSFSKVFLRNTSDYTDVLIDGNGGQRPIADITIDSITIVNTKYVMQELTSTSTVVDPVNYIYSHAKIQATLPEVIASVTTEGATDVNQDGFVTCTFTRSSTRIDYPLAIKYTITGVDQGIDIYHQTGSIVLGAGQTSRDLEIQTIDNMNGKSMTVTVEDTNLYNLSPTPVNRNRRIPKGVIYNR